MVGQKLGLTAAVLLAGCGGPTSETHSMESMETVDVAEPRADAPVPATTGPRIAYSYTVTYAFDRSNVAQVQGQQLDLCRTLGPARCLIVKSTLNTPGPNDHVVTDEAVLMVAAGQADALTRRFDAIAEAGGARRSSRQVEAEDVTRQVVDTDAQVRAKQALAERLLTIIRSRNGKVGELVEAERAYAATNEELEAAKGRQTELAQRVAMSRLSIQYAFNDTPGGTSPILASVVTVGDTLSTSVAALVTFVAATLPWAIVGGLLLVGMRGVARRRGWRWPWRRRERPAD